MNAFTIGSPIALSDGMYGEVKNVAASWDFVSWGTRLSNGVKSLAGGNSAPINTVKTNGGALKAHLYGKPTYQKALKNRFDTISSR